MSSEQLRYLLSRVSAVCELCPDMRFGQVMATLDLLAQDMTDKSLYHVDDEDFVTVVERFHQDLLRRGQHVTV